MISGGVLSYKEVVEGADDFLLRKARQLAGQLPAGRLRLRLEILADALEAALEVQALDPSRVDRLADDLEDLLDEAEATLVN